MKKRTNRIDELVYEAIEEVPPETTVSRRNDDGEHDHECEHEHTHDSASHSVASATRSFDHFFEESHSAHNGSSIPWGYWIIMISLGIANSSDASEILCISYILSNADFEEQMHLQGEPWRASLLAAAVFLGMLLGGLLVGTLGDLLGRRPTLLFGLILNSLAGIFSACVADVIQLSLLRAVSGFGIGATVPPLFTLVTELAPPSRRGFYVTFVAGFWMVGSIYVALTALIMFEYYDISWRIFALACAIPSALGAIMVATFVPESPRFLALKGQQEQAVWVANSIAVRLQCDGQDLSISEVLDHYPKRSTAVIGGGSTDSTMMTEIESSRYSFGILQETILAFFRSTSKLYQHNLRATTYALQLIWFSICFGSYGIFTWINTLFVRLHLENVYFNALLFALANFPGNIFAAILLDRVGHKVILMGASLASAVSLMGFAYFAWDAQTSSSDNDDRSSNIHTIGIVVSSCFFQAFIIAAWAAIDCLTSELFPTSVRSTGMGMCAASGRIGAMLAQFVNGALVDRPVSMLLVASSSLLVGAITPSLLPGHDMALQPLVDDLEES